MTCENGVSREQRQRFRASLEGGGLVVAPGVFDMVSAKLADTFGFPAVYMTGYGTVASHLGLPDAGLATYSEMVARVGQIAGGISTPLVADADTGFGNLLNARRTMVGYERAGAAAIQIEDQVFPKRCGHTLGRQVVPIEDMVGKIRAAVEVRSDDNFLIVARTDARTAYGLEEALRRAEAYADAGADVLFIESPEDEGEMERIGRTFDLPLVANMVEGGRTPILPASQLEALGYRLVIYPVTALLAGAKAMEQTYRSLRETGSSRDVTNCLFDFSAFHTLMGFEEIWELESRYSVLPTDTRR